MKPPQIFIYSTSYHRFYFTVVVRKHPYFLKKRYLSTASNIEHSDFLSYSKRTSHAVSWCVGRENNVCAGSRLVKRSDNTPCFFAMNLYVSCLKEWYVLTARYKSSGSWSGKQSWMLSFRNIVTKSRWTRLLVIRAIKDVPWYRLRNSTVVPGCMSWKHG